ncbi:hypothetical protein BR93DRAFT_967299 [Coniochaeta sp. PMI_546]|nr:hypothetical protein BR93DRAFT_967299 [Coniochaeta sp. PMI_546]
MSTLFTTTSRWATTVTGRVQSLAKRKGADVVQSALNSRPVELVNRTVSGYDLADKANMFFSAIGASNIKIRKKGNRDGSPAPELRKTKRKKKKKKRQRTCTDHGTGTAEACRERSASSESDDTDTISESDSDSTECVDDDDDSSDCIDGVDDSIVEDTGSSTSSSSSIPDMDSIDYNDDDEWVRLKYRNQEERAEHGRYIDALDEGFQPTRNRIRPPRSESAFTTGPGRQSAECPAGEGREPETKTEDGRVGTTWRGVSMEAVMFVPEVPEETDVLCSPYSS